MLEENKELADKLKSQYQEAIKKRQSQQKLKNGISIKLKFIFLCAIVLILLIKPAECGSFIGQWIVDFFGSIAEPIKNKIDSYK